MKVLFDQNVPAKLRKFLRGHWTTIPTESGWSELKNGDLIAAAERAGFELLITCDQNLQYQQNLTSREIAVDTNDWKILDGNIPAILDGIATAQTQRFVFLQIAAPGN